MALHVHAQQLERTAEMLDELRHTRSQLVNAQISKRSSTSTFTSTASGFIINIKSVFRLLVTYLRLYYTVGRHKLNFKAYLPQNYCYACTSIYLNVRSTRKS